MDDDRLDTLIRRASIGEEDPERMAREVLRRVRQGRGASPTGWLAGWGPGLAAAGFAALLAATPIVVARFPADPVDLALGVALGAPDVLFGLGLR